MSRWRLSPAAESQLRDLYRFTRDRWGTRQADEYLDRLFEMFDALSERRELWRPIPPEFGVVGFFCRHERHFIYWRTLDESTIGIAAILHVAMMRGDRLRQLMLGSEPATE